MEDLSISDFRKKSKILGELRASSAMATGGERASALIPTFIGLVAAWGLLMGVVVDFVEYKESLAAKLEDVTDNECGICGHACALTVPFFNYCTCWITLIAGGGCSCLACAQ